MMSDSNASVIEVSESQTLQKVKVSSITPPVELEINDTLHVLETKDSINKQN